MTRFGNIAAMVAALSMSALAIGAKEEDPTQSHWALRPLVAPPVPANAKHPIDAFINAELAKRGLSAAPEAERHILIRRVYFDLIGLPPPPEAIQRFVEDRAPDAYERLVNALLASPRFGERWARHWIDAAHFAETHGHDQDRIRPNAWPYRDYLIASFNSDKPYARFVEEQVAGDALFPDDPQATVALGFLAAGPWDESSLRDIREDTIDRQIGRYLDRDDVVSTVMSTFTSATVHCARCHDHKFDPISQEDYYALQAVFAGVERANRVFDRDPGIHRKRRELLAEKRALDRKTPALIASTTSAAVAARVTDWERRLKSDSVRWKPLHPFEAKSAHGATLTVQQDASILSSGTLPDKDVYTLRAAAPLGAITAIRLEVLPDASLPQEGPGRRENGNLHLSEFELYTGDANLPEGQRRIDLRNATADFNQADWIITQALDGNEQTAWGIYPKVGEAHEAIFELRETFHPKGNAPLIVALKQLHGRGHLIGRLRVSVTDAALPVRVNVFPEKIRAILDQPAERRAAEQQQELALYWMQIDIERRLSELPPPELIYAAASDFAPDGAHVPPKEPRTVHLLNRGDIRKPGKVARPGALSCISSAPARFAIAPDADESARRVALARWLSDPNNPLTWRSIVNRIWHHHFGRGLVDTPNDFGKMGSAPSHPELLDWLSVWFRDGGGTLKRLHQLMVTSAAYRRASTHSTSNAAVDADNRFLWRMNRQRLDAECVRDAILQMTGRLDLRMGGPSDQQFELKPGHHVTPLVNYNKFDVDSEGGRRRSIYRFLFRTLPDPFMDALDCPSGDQLTGKRNVSVTVQQAFALWNSAFTTRHAEHLAEHLKARAPELKGQVFMGCQLAWGRPPTGEEATEMMRFGNAHGLANLCRVLLNSNEFLFVD